MRLKRGRTSHLIVDAYRDRYWMASLRVADKEEPTKESADKGGPSVTDSVL